jgi:putative addiction module component (TIGR02574 family)
LLDIINQFYILILKLLFLSAKNYIKEKAMRLQDIPEIIKLSAPEKILLLEDLWDTIIADYKNVPFPESHKNELKNRMEYFKSNPGSLLTLEEIQNRIDQKK